MTSSADQKLSLRALIALVVGSMVGSGIFAIPSAFGRATGGLGALIAWTIAGVGMLMLALKLPLSHSFMAAAATALAVWKREYVRYKLLSSWQ